MRVTRPDMPGRYRPAAGACAVGGRAVLATVLGVPPDAFALALAGAVVHAGWNLGVGDSRSPRSTAAMALLMSVTVGLVPAVVWWRVPLASVPWIAASSALELAYIALLARAYARSDVRGVYPVARGAAPLLVLAASVAAGATLTLSQVAGVCAVVAGIGIVYQRQLRAGRGELLLPLAISTTIAAYTLVDKIGVRHASPVSYYELVLLGPAAVYGLRTFAGTAAPSLREAVSGAAVLSGAGMFVAYVLVLAALQRAPAAPVSAVRESSILMLPLFAAALRRRPPGWLPSLGALMAASGVAAVALR
jgi:drug/metabolite transporter (DMT)-like permease